MEVKSFYSVCLLTSLYFSPPDNSPSPPPLPFSHSLGGVGGGRELCLHLSIPCAWFRARRDEVLKQ